MLIVFIRVFVLYTVLLISLRVLGKRQVSTLQPYELVTIILLADVASIPMATTGTPLVNGIVGVFALLLVSYTVSFITMRSARARAFISGRPTIIVANGRIVEPAMEELRYTMDDLMEQLRVLGYPNISDVEYAVLETNGQLSVVPKSQKRPVQAADVGVSTEYEGLPIPLVIDGEVDVTNLERIGLDTSWLEQQLSQRGVESPQQVLYAALDTSGNLYCQPKSRNNGARKNGATG